MWLEHFRISKHGLLSPPVAPDTLCARAWKEGWDTLKPHLCAWVLCGEAADTGPGGVGGCGPLSEDPSAGHPTASRWCPPSRNTEGNPAKVMLRLRPTPFAAASHRSFPK